MELPGTTGDATYGSDESTATYVVKNVRYYQYMEVHFYFECKVSDNLYVQLRKCGMDNPPRSLAPHNYFEKETRNHHVYYGLDPSILRPLPREDSPYFKVIDWGPDLKQIAIVRLHFDEKQNRLEIFKGSDGSIQVKGDSCKLIFTIKSMTVAG